MNKEFPNSFYRGISSFDFITSSGYVSAGAFKFSPYDEQLRDNDNFCELSINWNDDEGALNTLLAQHKVGKDDKQFKAGYCLINLDKLRLVFDEHIQQSVFSYERKPIDANESNDYQENLYHGNLLIKDHLDKQEKKNAEHTLAQLAGRAFLRD